jgi:hypothetical protein
MRSPTTARIALRRGLLGRRQPDRPAETSYPSLDSSSPSAVQSSSRPRFTRSLGRRRLIHYREIVSLDTPRQEPDRRRASTRGVPDGRGSPGMRASCGACHLSGYVRPSDAHLAVTRRLVSAGGSSRSSFSITSCGRAMARSARSTRCAPRRSARGLNGPSLRLTATRRSADEWR